MQETKLNLDFSESEDLAEWGGTENLVLRGELKHHEKIKWDPPGGTITG